MISIYVNNKRRMTIAENADGLTTKQFIQLAPLIYHGGDEVSCKVKALRILSGMSVYRWKLLSAEALNRCIPYVDWLFEKERPVRITRQLITEYKKYHGPVSGFDNLKMNEFHFSELYYKGVINGNEEALDKLVAVLYRKAKKDYDQRLNADGDIRIAFNEHEVNYYEIKISKWPLKVKQAIFLWYDACREEMIENNPLVFKDQTSDFISQFETGLYGMMRSLAGNKLGTVANIETMYVHTAMLEIGLMREEEKYIESKMPKKPS